MGQPRNVPPCDLELNPLPQQGMNLLSLSTLKVQDRPGYMVIEV
jgi:hypothetical protein